MQWSQKKKSVNLVCRKKEKTFHHFENTNFMCHSAGYIFLNIGFIWESSFQALRRPLHQNVLYFIDVQANKSRSTSKLHHVYQSMLLGLHFSLTSDSLQFQSYQNLSCRLVQRYLNIDSLTIDQKIHDWVFIYVLLQYIHLGEVNPG